MGLAGVAIVEREVQAHPSEVIGQLPVFDILQGHAKRGFGSDDAVAAEQVELREELVLGELQSNLLRVELQPGIHDVGRLSQSLVPAVLLVEGHRFGS